MLFEDVGFDSPTKLDPSAVHMDITLLPLP